ncbi:MAG: pseudaminic acid cytidylyltransferase [Bacteroidetes bacterium]|nr:pseudaminic acid cytidylyltransferase [Bacteroidota bacterium]
MANAAIIIARGGSKRIPKKNIKVFRGKPIIAYSIETALNSGLFDYVMVSTDDDEIAVIAKRAGAEVPFTRSEKNSDDLSTTAEVILEVLTELKASGKIFENVCCIYPTAPFITKASLQNAFELLIKNKFDSVFPVCAFSYPIQRALQITDSKVTMQLPDNINKRSQDLQPSYHDAGQFYWLNTLSFLKEKKVFTQNSGSIILDEMQVQDIDTETDWKIAELKHALLFPDLK